MSYKLKLDIFEGPLDLLLYLIKKDDIDIHDIPISQVTEQYMQYIDMMKMLDLDVVGDFLVMAATLMQIKSRMLLPPDPNEQPEEELDPRDELARRLLEYKKFKEIAEALKEKELLRQDLFGRAFDQEEIKQFKADAKEIYYEASLFDLINAFSEALKRAPEEVIHEIITEEFTVEQKLHDVLHYLLEHSPIRLQDLFTRCRHKIEIIVTFLAVLELIRLKELVAVQKGVFGEIEIMRNQQNIVPIGENETDDGRTQTDPVQPGN
ncbi:MAG: segregation/condensation protein A [Candidatus Omnitrophica bacterium]|nr:segregation/condensation protein A [Candidatus Omnitrophota bacterium]